jgi:hypothetical protein
MTHLTYRLEQIGILRPRWAVHVTRRGAILARTTTTYYDSETAALAYVASLGSNA